VLLLPLLVLRLLLVVRLLRLLLPLLVARLLLLPLLVWRLLRLLRLLRLPVVRLLLSLLVLRLLLPLQRPSRRPWRPVCCWCRPDGRGRIAERCQAARGGARGRRGQQPQFSAQGCELLGQF
jgi:hypothetical protein